MNRHLAFLALTLAAWLLAGCGGGTAVPQQSSQTGKLTLTVVWPAASGRTSSRVIPAATQSVTISVTQGSFSEQQVIPRSQGAQSTVTIGNLPLGTVTLAIQAKPNPDGTGVTLAQATVQVSIVANQTTPVTVTLNSTIASIAVTGPSSPLAAGQTFTPVATPKDAAGNVIPVPPGNLSWSSDAPSVASVDPATGVVTGVTAGTAHITVTESDSGVKATITVMVHLVVTVSPATPTITLGQAQPFTATVIGSANQAVTWSVLETAGGSITNPGGVYTPPAQPGTYHVVATSQADTSQSGQATVTVTAGSAVVIAQ